MNPIAQKLPLVPTTPGVYVMRDQSNQIIYIGKAKNLRNRVSSYFRGAHDLKTTKLVSKITDFEYFVTATEHDALGLEANLIKQHKPHYNILLKDNKAFPYIKINSGTYPHLEITRKVTKGGAYFGPYFNGISARELLATLSDIFPLRTCRNMAKTPCLNLQIGRCPGVCTKTISPDDYAKTVTQVKDFLSGRNTHNARKTLQHKMENAAALEQFELAIRYRTGLELLDKLKQRTITHVAKDLNCDVFAFATKADIFAVSVLTIRGGKMIGVQNFSDRHHGIHDENEMLESFTHQYYLEHVRPPKVITPLDTTNTHRKLVTMAQENATEYLDTSIEKIQARHQFTHGATVELSQHLGLEHPPQKIECYDISHMDGTHQVASMVVFTGGEPNRKLYRRFRIRHTDGNDDFKSMAEVLTRRLNRLTPPQTCPSFAIAPDLIIVDGGKGQLSSALEVLTTLNKHIPIISLAKRNEEIFVPHTSDPIILPARSYALRLVQRIRDEAHRFAVTYHKKLREKPIK